MIRTLGLAAAAIAALSIQAVPAKAQANEPFLGQIIYVGFNFCPRGWAMANGQLLQISQHTALFSLYGTQYGGDGRTTFALPDLRGRVAVHHGTGPGMDNVRIGQKGGGADNRKNVVPQYLAVTACVAIEGIFPSRS